MIKKLPCPLNVLVGCESSGIIRDSFRLLGHTAMSCDLKPTEREGPHYEGNIKDVLEDSTVGMWDLFICHPPCTYITSLAARWMARHSTEIAASLWFVRYLLNCPIKHTAIENPMGLINTHIKKPSQTIHPWQFGDSFDKRTCLWLKGLPLLKHTKIVPRGEQTLIYKRKRVFLKGGGWKWEPYTEKRSAWFEKAGNSENRSRTFLGIASAMANQWSAMLQNERK